MIKKNMLIKKEIHKLIKELLKHEWSILSSFNHSPYERPKCSTKLELLCDEWNGLPIEKPLYAICAKCKYDKYIPLDYQSKKRLSSYL